MLDRALLRGEVPAAALLDRFGPERRGDVVLNFGGSDRLTIEEVTLVQLVDSIEIA